MVFSLRLPPDLDREARARAEQIGVPLNGLICFALDLYLRGGSISQPPKAKPPAAPTSDKVYFEAQVLAMLKGSSNPVLITPVAPSGPPLPPGPGASKAERRAYTDHLRASRKNSGVNPLTRT